MFTPDLISCDGNTTSGWACKLLPLLLCNAITCVKVKDSGLYYSTQLCRVSAEFERGAELKNIKK